jgi:prevent-host-death family protein
MEIGAYKAKTHLPELIERVRRGERITITKHGKPVAELRPVTPAEPEALREAFARLDTSRARLRARGVKITKADILSAIREGRR